MRKMKWMLVMAAVVAGWMAGSAIGETPANLPEGKAILAKYVEATGGRAVYEKVKSRVTTSKVTFPAQNLSGTVTIYQQAPDKMYSETDLGAAGKVQQGMNGDIVWENSAMMGPRIVSGPEKEIAKRTYALGTDLEPEKYYTTIQTTGVEDVKGKPAYKVELTAKDGAKETRWYDKESGLLTQTQATVKTQMGEIPFTGSIEEWGEFDGMKVPTKSVQSTAQFELRTSIEKLENNTEISADKFELPKDVKALLAKQSGSTTKPK